MWLKGLARLSAGLLAILFVVSTPQAAEPTVRLATTTSTDNSGLLKALLPPFEQSTGYKVHVIAVGTGKALRLGQNGDVDVVMVHAPAAEQRFVDTGHGVNRRGFMYNDFVIVGPKNDPAGVRGMRDATSALKRIAEQQATFVSRGDDSGTHKKEVSLWAKASTKPQGSWYRAAGQGMGKVLQMATELQAYTLTDRGTWLAMQGKLTLDVFVEGDERLSNPYGIIAVNPNQYPDINYKGAMALIAWVTSPEGQAIIRDFKVNGQALFIPTAVQLAKGKNP
jgi:tungstate transport system substrate-binding protein